MSLLAVKNGFTNEANSSSIALNSLQTFTGEWQDVSMHESVMLAVLTDQDGDAFMQFSPDGSNVDSSLTYKIKANLNDVHRLSVTRKYYRVKFTNTSINNQTFFRLQTLFGNQTALAAPANLSIQQDADAIISRPTNYNYEVALDKWVDNTTWNKWGYNDDIDIGTETVWSTGGIFIPLSSASGITVVSTSINDTNGGSGTNSIIVYAIDENREAKTIVVTMNGTTPVVVPTSTLNTLGINRCSIFVSGSSEVNEGKITVTATTGGSVQAEIPIGQGSTQQAIFFTQANHTALADWLHININKIGGAGSITTIKAWVKSFVSNSKYEVARFTIDSDVENNVTIAPSQPFVIGEKSIFYLEATAGSNNTIVSARFSLIETRTG